VKKREIKRKFKCQVIKLANLFHSLVSEKKLSEEVDKMKPGNKGLYIYI
jgi:hypothetical protein